MGGPRLSCAARPLKRPIKFPGAALSSAFGPDSAAQGAAASGGPCGKAPSSFPDDFGMEGLPIAVAGELIQLRSSQCGLFSKRRHRLQLRGS
jgi:hypothetical protein